MNTTSLQISASFVLAIQNEAYREYLASLMGNFGFHLDKVGSPDIVYQLTREQHAKSWVILDTEDDVAWLVQLVNDYHRSPFHLGGEAPIVCLVSVQVAVMNPRLGTWLIDGSAAVFSVRNRDTDLHLDLHRMFRSLNKERDIEPEHELPTYDNLVTRILQEPTEGQGLLDLGMRLDAWQNSHWTRHEMSRAFLRHAVKRMPDNAQARRCYGESLFRIKPEEGLFHLREAVRLAPDDAEGYVALGRCLVDVDRVEALKTLLKAVQLDPDGNSGNKARNVIASSGLCRE